MDSGERRFDMSGEKGSPLPDTNVVFYQTEEGNARIQVRLHDGTAWLNKRMMAELYQVAVQTINEHILNIYNDRELFPEATIRKFRIVQTEGNRQVERLLDFLLRDRLRPEVGHGGGHDADGRPR